MKQVHVAVGVVVVNEQDVLIARRPDDKHQGGLWEFPGGKVEEGEDVVAALTRELDEEVALNVRPETVSPLMHLFIQFPRQRCNNVFAFFHFAARKFPETTLMFVIG